MENQMRLRMMKLLYEPLKSKDNDEIEAIYEQARYNTFSKSEKNNYKCILYSIVLFLLLIVIAVMLNLILLERPLEDALSPINFGVNMFAINYLYHFFNDIIRLRIMNKQILKLLSNNKP